MPIPPSCELCDQHCESVVHLYFECPFVLHICTKLIRCIQGMIPTPITNNHWLLIENAARWKDELKLYFFFILKKLLMVIWKERNMRVFEGKCGSKETIWTILKQEILKGMHDSNHRFLDKQFEPWIP